MERLSSLDASFVLAETPGLPMHISSVSIYRPAFADASDAPSRFYQIIQRFEQMIYRVSMLRRRLCAGTKKFTTRHSTAWRRKRCSRLC